MDRIVVILTILGIIGMGVAVSTPVQGQPQDQPRESAKDQDREAQQEAKEELVFMEIPVVFAAAKFEQPSTEAPATVTIIGSDEIERYGYRTIDEALRSITGLYVTYDYNYKYLGVRGYCFPGDYNSRVLLLIDGIAYNDDIYGSAALGTVFGIDMDQVKRIEIVKGPGSALYGTNALFAVINVVTKDAGEASGARLSGEYGSHNSKKGLIGYGRRYDDLGFLVSGSYLDTAGRDLYFPEYNGYEDETGAIHNGIFRNGDWDKSPNVWGKLSYKQLGLEGGYKRRDKGIPTGVYATVFNDNRTKNIDEIEFLEFKYAPKLDETRNLLARVYYNRYRYYGDWIMWYEGETGYYKEMGKDIARGDWVGSELQLNWKISTSNRLTTGGEAQYHNLVQKYGDAGLLGEAYRCQYLNDRRQFGIWSLYAQDIYRVGDLSFVLGARHDDYPTFGGTTNPRLACIYNPFDKTNIKVLYGTAFRAPSPYELYYHDGYYTMEPNKSLSPERLRTTELVIDQGIGPNANALLSVYHTTLTDLIYQVLTADTGLTNSPMLQFQNVRKVAANGVELTLNGTYAGIHARLGYSYQETQDENTSRQLVNSPSNSGNLNVSVPFLSAGNYLSSEVRYVGRRMMTNREWLRSYALMDVVLFMKELIPHFEITAKVNNLFDTSYEDPCSTEYLQTRLPGDRRGFFLKLTYRSKNHSMRQSRSSGSMGSSGDTD